jgi:apolipoprotein N-acyltransferase
MSAAGLALPGCGRRNSTERNAFEFSTPSNLLQKTSIRWAAGTLSGLLLVACFPKLNGHALVWVACLPLLAALVSERHAARAFGVAYLSGAIFLAGSCYWFVGVMERYGRLNPALAFGVLGLFVFVFSFFFGVFGLVIGGVARASPGVALALSPFLWVTIELARTYLITGFPWNLLGYAVQASGLRQLASVTAVYGLSFLAVATSALLAWLSLAAKARRAWMALCLWSALLVVTHLALAPPALSPGPNLSLLLQPNVPLDESVMEGWAPWRDPTQLKQLVDMTVSAVAHGYHAVTSEHAGRPAGAPALIVWAENPAPFFFTRDPVFRTAVESMARLARAYVVVNTVNPVGPDNAQATNSAVVLDPDGRLLLMYDKIHLVPFGEYVPAWAFPGRVGKITSEVGNYVPGSSYRVAPTPQGGIGVFICYEAIFPQLVRRLTRAGAGVLVNISNDAWYGDSAAAFQHLEMARLRAIENGRYLLRATNDGITAVIDPYGRVAAQIPRHQATVMLARFDYSTRKTFYTAHGDVFAWLCVAVTAVLIAVAWYLATDT